MKRPLIFVQDPNALKNWLTACGTDAKILYDLDRLDERFTAHECIVLIQLSDLANIDQVKTIIQQKFDVLLFSNTPSTTEGLALFQLGIKGYLNTFATVERIEQALAAISAGSIWLGSDILQKMIQSVTSTQAPNDRWKEIVTDREQQVALLVLESKSNKEIAEQLNITERTVKAHMHNMFEKFEVSDRLSLVLKIKNYQ
jgi:DNA-binding NarL/FixJ family response regulator